jgi:hypothetical protein
MTLTCPRCHLATALLVDGLCLDCEAHAGHERFEAFCESCADEAWRDSPLRQREAAEDYADWAAKL